MTSKTLSEGPVSIPTTEPSFDTEARIPRDNDLSGYSGQSCDFLSLICTSNTLAPEVPQVPNLDQNIAELQFMLQDADLGHAAEKLWSTFYGQDSAAAYPVEDWVHRFWELLSEEGNPGEGALTNTHKSQLYFLRHLLKEEDETVERTGGNLQGALLEKLRHIAGLALGGDAIGLQPLRETLQRVREHESPPVGRPAGLQKSLLPRSLVPIVGTRNPFLVVAHVSTLAKAGVPVEPGLPSVQNMKRLHTETCMPGKDGSIHIPCTFQQSTLAKSSQHFIELDDDLDHQANHHAQAELLKQAHTTISGLGALECKMSSYRGKNLGSADWGLQLRAVDPKVQKGKEGATERLNLAIATMFTTSSLDSASSFWLAFDRRTAKQAIKEFRKNIVSILRSVKLDYLAQLVLSDHAIALPHEELQAALDSLQGLGRSTDGMRAQLALYSIRYPQQKEIVLRSPMWVKILYSHSYIPRFVRNMYFKFTAGALKRTREQRIQIARKVLREKLPASFFQNLFSPFKFTAHSAALMQIINFHSMKHDEFAGALEGHVSKEKSSLRHKSVAAGMDEQIKAWAHHGYDSALLTSHKDFLTFERAWKKIDLKDLPLPDLTDWWIRLKALVTAGLEAYLAEEKHLEPFDDNVYKLASDSLRNVNSDGNQTMFFTRVAHRQEEGALRRLWGSTKHALLKLLYRSPSRIDGVWFGVAVDFMGLISLLNQVKHVIESESSVGIKINFEEALLREMEVELRIRGTDVSRVPLLVKRNTGMLGVRSDYGALSDAERETEFQNSMCLDHCRSLWQMALVAILPSMLRPQMMQHYEKSFGTEWALKHLSDPALVNSSRMILKSDAALKFFDHSTPKEIHEELKGLQSGQAVMFANYMLFSSRAHHHLGNQYLGLHLQQQAPFMGNMILDWIATRRRNAISAIVSSVVLTFIGVYALMSFFDILQNLTISGTSPPFDCVWNPVFQDMACNPVPGGSALNTTWLTALNQVFLIGLFAGTSGSMFHFLTVKSAISLVVNQSKTLMRLQMALGSALMRLFRRGKRSFTRIHEWFQKRKALRRLMLKRAMIGQKTGSRADEIGMLGPPQMADQVLDRVVSSGRLVISRRAATKVSLR
ncbi:rhoptry neck protein 2-like protein 2 [Cyclospora cayetanensis]|uniref:Rhoptry neck protein 2-like protein 2 n=1 Tax=Cyclospora cayetanensis TaxID=88456 RepID=A0A6P6RXL9_9EIME|nr:rhoptry neck protein 2-like protein 2 [Cyclospora cayetanensis]